MEIHIRNIKKEELPEAATVFVEAFNGVGEMWTYDIALKRLESLFDPKFYFGAFVDNKLEAIMSTKIDYCTDHKELYIDIFAVSPKHQGKNIGQLFLDEIESFAKELDIDRIWLQTSPKLPSYNFYIKRGFIATDWVAIYKNI